MRKKIITANPKLKEKKYLRELHTGVTENGKKIAKGDKQYRFGYIVGTQSCRRFYGKGTKRKG